MDNNLPTDDNQKPVTPVETPPPGPESPSVIPETPEETPSTTPPPVIEETPPITLPEEPKQETPEPIIEIGSLSQPSLSTIQDVSGKTSNKSKKIKSVVSVLGLLLIIISLPLAVILVKQRQEIRKEAAGTGEERSGWTTFCEISLGPKGPGSYSGGNYTTTYTIKNLRTSGSNRSVEIHKYGCVCDNNSLDRCGTESGRCETDTQTVPIGPGSSVDIPITAKQSAGDCGTLQTDLFVISVDGISDCHNN